MAYIENKYFRKDRLQCSCCGEYFMDETFLRALIALREEYNAAMVISSGCRCEKHEIEAAKIAKGKKAGAHCKPYGRAVDVKIGRNKAYKLLGLAIQKGFRVGVSQRGKHRFIHLDNLTAKDEARFANKLWSY